MFTVGTGWSGTKIHTELFPLHLSTGTVANRVKINATWTSPGIQ